MRSTTLLLAGICLCHTATSAHAAPDSNVARPPVNSLMLAETLKQSGNPQAATAILRERTNAPGATAEDFLELAANLQSIKSYAKAIKTLQRAQRKYPDNTIVIYQLGRAHIAAGHSKKAVHVMDMLTAMEPGNAMAYNAKAVAFDKAGNHFAAQEIYETALQIEPESPALQNNLAMSLILNHQPDEAIVILERLHKASEKHPKVRYNLALAYGLTGQQKKARQLGLKDLSKKNVQENLKFYEHYTTLKKQHTPVSLFTEDDQVLLDQQEDEQIALQKTPIKELSPSAGTPEHGMELKKEKKEPFFGLDAVYTYPKKKQRD